MYGGCDLLINSSFLATCKGRTIRKVTGKKFMQGKMSEKKFIQGKRKEKKFISAQDVPHFDIKPEL